MDHTIRDEVFEAVNETKEMEGVNIVININNSVVYICSRGEPHLQEERLQASDRKYRDRSRKYSRK